MRIFWVTAVLLIAAKTGGSIYSQSDQARKHFLKGVELHKANRLEEARFEFLAAIDLGLGDATPEIYIRLAQVSNGTQEPAEVLHVLKAGLEKYPTSADLANDIGLLYLDFGNFDESIRLAGLAVQLAPDNPVYRRNLARAYHAKSVKEYEGRRYFESLALTRKALELNPEIAAFHQLHGLSLLFLHQLSEATHSLERALEMEQTNAGFAADLSLAYLARGDLKRAETLLQMSVALLLAQAGRKLVNDRPLAAQLAEASKLFPELKQLHLYLGHAYKLQGQADRAIKAMEEGLSEYPDFLAARLELGEIYLRQEKLYAALDHLRHAAKLDSTNARGQLLLGRALAGVSENEEAINSLLRAAQLEPTLAYEAYHRAAQLFLRMGRDDLARSMLKKIR